MNDKSKLLMYAINSIITLATKPEVQDAIADMLNTDDTDDADDTYDTDNPRPSMSEVLLRIIDSPVTKGAVLGLMTLILIKAVAERFNASRRFCAEMYKPDNLVGFEKHRADLRSITERVLNQMAHGQDRIMLAIKDQAALVSEALGEWITPAKLLRLTAEELDKVLRWAAVIHAGEQLEVTDKIAAGPWPGRAALRKLTRDSDEEPYIDPESQKRERLLLLSKTVLDGGTGAVSLHQEAELVANLANCHGAIAPMLLALDSDDRNDLVRLAAYAHWMPDALDPIQLSEYAALDQKVDVIGLLEQAEARVRREP